MDIRERISGACALIGEADGIGNTVGDNAQIGVSEAVKSYDKSAMSTVDHARGLINELHDVVNTLMKGMTNARESEDLTADRAEVIRRGTIALLRLAAALGGYAYQIGRGKGEVGRTEKSFEAMVSAAEKAAHHTSIAGMRSRK